MESSDLKLIARAGEELAVLLELHTGYPDNPERLLQSDPKAASVVTDIFRRLIEGGGCIPGPVAHLVAHVHARGIVSHSNGG